jgi:hypothetical protein
LFVAVVAVVAVVIVVIVVDVVVVVIVVIVFVVSTSKKMNLFFDPVKLKDTNRSTIMNSLTRLAKQISIRRKRDNYFKRLVRELDIKNKCKGVNFTNILRANF